jgi:transposase-like protein
MGSITGFAGTEAVGLARPAQCDLTLAAQAEFIICNQSIDEVFLTINGERHYLWRAIDQDDNVLDILVQSRRNKKAAKKFFRKLLKGLQYVPRVIITDKLKSYRAAKREILPGVEHRQSRYLNNRCENSHRPTRQRGSVACRGLTLQRHFRVLTKFTHVESRLSGHKRQKEVVFDAP